MTYIDEMKAAIKEAMEQKWGELDDSGCNCFVNGDYEWMSTERFYNLVCDVLDENDWLFADDE